MLGAVMFTEYNEIGHVFGGPDFRKLFAAQSSKISGAGGAVPQNLAENEASPSGLLQSSTSG
jgi:hypothetical protein